MIRNIPESLAGGHETFGDIRSEAGFPKGALVVLWQGGVGPSRLLEPIVQALALAPKVHLIIRGPGTDSYGPRLLEIAAKADVSNRVCLLPPVPADAVVAAARSASVGIWSLPNLAPNFYYALPNKVFEYLAAGLPIAGAAFPEVKAIIERYGVGVSFDPYDPHSIATALNRLSDPEFYALCRSNIGDALVGLRADNEWYKLVTLYETILKPEDKSLL